MKIWGLLLVIMGVLLMASGLMSGQKADTLDMGGCGGAEYPCVSTTVYGKVTWTGRQEVTSIVINVRVPGGEGMGYSNSVYADGDGSYYISNIPSWDEIAGTWHHYEGSIDVIINGVNRGHQEYWRTIAGGVTTHSSNWITGDSYRLDFTVTTEGTPGETPNQPNQPGQSGQTNVYVTQGPQWGLFFIGLLLFILGIVMVIK